MSLSKNKSFKSIFNLYSSGNFINLSKTKLMTIEKSPDLKKNKSTKNIISKTPKNLNFINNKDEIIKELRNKIVILEEKIKILENQLLKNKQHEFKCHTLSRTTSLKDIKSNFNNVFSKNKNIRNKNNFNTINTDKIFKSQPKKNKIYKKSNSSSSEKNKNYSNIKKERLLKTDIKVNSNSNKFKNFKFIPKIPKKINTDMNFSLSMNNSINYIKQEIKNNSNLILKQKLNNIKERTEKIIKKCLNYI
jgi:hypothetical protein